MRENVLAQGLLEPVDGVDANGGVANDELTRTRRCEWGRANLEDCLRGLQPGCLILQLLGHGSIWYSVCVCDCGCLGLNAS